MKRFLAIAALFAATVLAPAAAQADEDKNQRSEWLPEFNGVYVSAAIDIRFVQAAESEAPRIVYDIAGGVDTRFRAEVDKHGVLNITEKIMRDSRRKTRVVVYYHSIESLEVTDACVEFDNVLTQSVLTLDVSGRALFEAELQVTDLEVVLSGKGTRAKLTGAARYVDIDAASGHLDASGLDAMSVEVTAAYGAGVAVRASERLKTSASASATISYRGKPAIVKNRESVLGGTVKAVEDDGE